jgi:glycosyltransferase involved in cell wall biosynthesis
MAAVRVLWVVDVVDASIGSFNSVLGILRHLDRDAFDVVAVVPAPGRCSQALEGLGARVLYRPIVASGKTLRYLGAVISAYRMLRREACGLVYFTDHARWRPAELLAARLARLPAVVRFGAPPSDAMAADPSLRGARAIIGDSRATLRPLRGHMPDTALHVVYPCIDLDRFGRGPDRRGNFFARDAPIVGFVGMFRPEKGIEYFLEMAAILRTARPDVRYLAVGGESAGERNWLARMQGHAAACGVDDVVHFAGLRTDIPEIMRTLDVLVVPSLTEGFGAVIVEANAAGVPVVASSVGGIPEVLEDGITGILVPPRSAAALAAAVQRILDDGAWRARVAALAPARVRARFSPAAQVRASEAIWRAALAEP